MSSSDAPPDAKQPGDAAGGEAGPQAEAQRKIAGDSLDSLVGLQEWKNLTETHLAVKTQLDAQKLVRSHPPVWTFGHKKAVYEGGEYVSHERGQSKRVFSRSELFKTTKRPSKDAAPDPKYIVQETSEMLTKTIAQRELMERRTVVGYNRYKDRFEGACPRGAKDFSGRLTFMRWRMMEMPKVLHSKRPLKSDIRPDVYQYAPEKITSEHPGSRLIEFYVNFSDKDLFGGYSGKLLDQDELMVVEHPVLGSLREKLIRHQSDSRLIDTHKIVVKSAAEVKETTASPVCVTPCVILGAQRHVHLDTLPNKRRGIPKGLYGREFGLATRSQVLKNCRQVRPTSMTNVLCMSSDLQGKGAYTMSQIRSLLQLSYTGFRAAIASAMAHMPASEAESKEEGVSKISNGSPPAVVIHTGPWGCGSSGGNIELSCIIQTLAARLAGVSHLVFHAVNNEVASLSLKGYRTLYALTERSSVYPLKSLLKTLVAKGYKWGSSTIYREPLHKPANKLSPKNPTPTRARVPKQLPPPGAPRDLTLESAGENDEDDKAAAAAAAAATTTTEDNAKGSEDEKNKNKKNNNKKKNKKKWKSLTVLLLHGRLRKNRHHPLEGR
uniref:PARG catalytic Macro domain-containing protein n=1 Tax=Lotharella globosa TaxID=91324 RepID=A0A7S3Z5G7_9EUKA